MSEWTPDSRWNPYNSAKLLQHVDYWRPIAEGRIPPPILVTVDPSNRCQYDCEWCNSAAARSASGRMLSRAALSGLAESIADWGVRAVCVAGGGEPLTNPETAPFIRRLTELGVRVGVVTNGYLINGYPDTLCLCDWVGVSVDAGTEATYRRLKRTGAMAFDRVVGNIRWLCECSTGQHLGRPGRGAGVTWKFLATPENVGEIGTAARLASESGCRALHCRPAGTPWDRLGKDEIGFDELACMTWTDQVNVARRYRSETFEVYAVTHKFGEHFQRRRTFPRCWAVYMTAVVSPPSAGAHPDAWTLGLCCDRRGDGRLNLLTDCTDPTAIRTAWGGEDHKRIADAIDLADCPRCTYAPHNELFADAVLADNMTADFI